MENISNPIPSDLDTALKPELLLAIQVSQILFTASVVVIALILFHWQDSFPQLSHGTIKVLIYCIWSFGLISYVSAFKLYNEQLSFSKAESLSYSDVKKYGLDSANPLARYVILICRVPVLRSVVLEPCSIAGAVVYVLGARASFPQPILLWSALLPVFAQVLLAYRTFPSELSIRKIFLKRVQSAL